MCVCLGWSAAGAHALPKVAGSRIFRSQSPLSPAVIMEFSAAERASGWHAKRGPDRGAGLRSTLTPPDLPLPASSHPLPRPNSACARLDAACGGASERAAPFCSWSSFLHSSAERGSGWGTREKGQEWVTFHLF